MLKKILFSGLLAMACLLTALAVHPSITYGQSKIIPEDHGNCGDYTGNCGNYELNDFIILAIKVSQWILGIVGSLSLIMFIYGGLSFLVSAGSSDKITKAKDIIVAAIIGLIIVFSSWLIIKFVMQSMGITWSGQILDIQ